MSEKKTYSCDQCLKEFTQKNDYLRHINKKYPCVTKEQFKELKNDELIELKEKMTETDALKFLESFFNKIKDLLRDQESITSDRALDVITDFLFLRLLNYEMDSNPDMNFITKKYNQEIKINNIDHYKIDEYKKYFRWSELMKLVDLIDKDSSNQENKQLLVDVISHVIFGGIFKFNENTKEIYKNRRFFVKKLTTIQRLLKEYNKIDFTKYDVDIKGKAYEMTLQKESVTNKAFSQYFTPIHIDKYMVSNIKIKVNKNGSYTKILDPACGTSGILCEYYSEVKRIAEKEKIQLDKNISKYILGCEIVDDTLKLAHMNMLLKSGSYNTNLKNVDFLEVECLDYVDEKLDANIIMNPPFALTKKYHLYDDDLSSNIFYGETKSGTLLFLMAGLNSIKDGNQLIMVSPNGKEIFSKNKEFVNIRKKTMDKANLFKIAILPDNSFAPYTSVQCLILMMEKGKKTKKIEFVKLEKDKDNILKETKLCSVKFEEIEKKNYSWNYKEYFINNIISYNNLTNKKISDLCDINTDPKHDTSYGKNDGNYIFHTGGVNTKLFVDNYDIDKLTIIINRTNGSGKCNMFLDKYISIASQTITFRSIDNDTNTKYIFYYLNINIGILESGYIGTNHKNISNDFVKNIEIPTPSVEVQNLIVKELDSMYKIKENSQNILDELETQRKAKFESLIFACKNTKKYMFEEICEFKNGKKITKDELIEGEYPVIGGGQKPMGFHNEYNTEANTILCSSSGAYAGYISRYNTKVWSSDCFLIKPKNNLLSNNYLYYYIKSQQEEIYKLQNGSAQPHVYARHFEKRELFIPSLEEQENIIKEMEYYDKLKEIHQTHITNTEVQIKERFEFHLNKCKESSETKNDVKEIINESESDEEEEEIKPLKKATSKKSKQIESESEEKEEKLKASSKKSSKKNKSKQEESLSDLEKELKEETPIIANKIKVVRGDKKEKKNKSRMSNA